MGEYTETTWTCDRCGAQDAVKLGQQPSFWARITKAQPPRHAEPKVLGDLCIQCRNDLDWWWRNPPEPEAVDDPSHSDRPTEEGGRAE
jgi:hypothetical protein